MQKNANDETLSITYGTQKCRNLESSKFATTFDIPLTTLVLRSDEISVNLYHLLCHSVDILSDQITLVSCFVSLVQQPDYSTAL